MFDKKKGEAVERIGDLFEKQKKLVRGAKEALNMPVDLVINTNVECE